MATPKGPDPWPGPVALVRAGVFLVVTMLAVAMGIAMAGTGPWYDEFYTLAVTPSGSGLADLFWRHWLADNHPPLFYALSWATGFLGDMVEPRRALNFVFFALTAWGLVVAARHHERGGLLFSLYAMMLASAMPAIDKTAELRSNYLALVAATLAIAALTVCARPGVRLRRPGAIALTLALMLAFNVHYTTTVIVGSVAAASGLRLIAARDWPGVRSLALAGAIAATPLLVTTALQAAAIDGNTRKFWIAPGLDPARWAIQRVLEDIVSLNPPATFAGIAGLAMLGWAWLRRRERDPELAAAVTLAIGAALGIMLLLAVHMVRPIIITRYLIALYPVSAMVLALGATALVMRMPRSVGFAVFALVPLAAMLGINTNLGKTLHRASWYGTGRAIAAVARTCPGTVVHADTRWNAPLLAMPPADNRQAIALAYAKVAKQAGFRLETASSRRMSNPCPTVFWAEHVGTERVDSERVARDLRSRGFAIGELRLRQVGRGWIALASRAD